MGDLERLRERVLGKYLRKRVVISIQDYRNLSREEKKKCDFFAGDYYYDAKLDIPPDEIDSFLALKSFEAQMESKNAIVTIKNIVVFIFVVNIIAALSVFALMNKGF